MRLVHVVQIQFQELELRRGCIGIRLLDLGLGPLNRILSTLLTATSQEDMCTMGCKNNGGSVSEPGVGASDDGDFSDEVWDLLVGIAVWGDECLPEGELAQTACECHVGIFVSVCVDGLVLRK